MCPTCGHAHPGGVGAGWCPCDDCALLWTVVPLHLLSPERRQRRDDLARAALDEEEQ